MARLSALAIALALAVDFLLLPALLLMVDNKPARPTLEKRDEMLATSG